MINRIKKSKGFTLVELLIVLGIIAVLTAIAIPVTSGIIEKSLEKEDNLNATLYTSYITKYANESPKKMSLSNLTTDEKLIASNAGQKIYPGALLENTYFATNEDMWKAIRKETIVAFKMSNDIAVFDNYFISPPKQEGKSFIYYYMLGEVKVKNLEEVIQETEQRKLLGNTTLSDFWVALDTEKGNGVAPTASKNGVVFIKLYKYGFSQSLPMNYLEGCNYETDIYIQSKVNGQIYRPDNITSNFANNNVLQFINIPNGTYQFYISASNIANYPGEEYSKMGAYSTSGEIVVNDSTNYKGNSLSNAYSVYLLSATKGSISATWQIKHLTFTNGNLESESVTDYNLSGYNIEFTNPNYSTTYYPTSNPLNLYDINNSQYLPLQTYNMKFVANGYRTQNENVQVSKNGIYPLGSSEISSEPYTYNVQAKKNTVDITGSIDFNIGKLKLLNNGIENIDLQLILIPSDPTYPIYTANLGETGDNYVRQLTTRKCGFRFKNVAWGNENDPNQTTTYSLYYKNSFSNSTKLLINNFVVDGSDINITASLSDNSFFEDFTIGFQQIVDSANMEIEITPNITVENIYTGEKYTITKKSKNTTLQGGFYKISYVYPSPYNKTKQTSLLIKSNNPCNSLNKGYKLSCSFGSITEKAYFNFGISQSNSGAIEASKNYYKYLKGTYKIEIDGQYFELPLTFKAQTIDGSNIMGAYCEVAIPLCETGISQIVFTYQNQESCFKPLNTAQWTGSYSSSSEGQTYTHDYEFEYQTNRDAHKGGSTQYGNGPKICSICKGEMVE